MREKQKENKYGQQCRNEGAEFLPLVMEASGAVGKHLSQLMRKFQSCKKLAAATSSWQSRRCSG